MKMLTKFESKSSRAKGVAFHPKRPWVLVSLHSSTIQLWDYRMGTLIDRFEEHDGPVRAVDFHPTQPIFVSGGDDYSIKVWSLQSRKCLFTLNGHLDYIRTVFFHHDLPWIISASDDQTIRIWNWQNRQEIACLTGHNHYVMCAQFHPTDDLIVSASLDQTVRVWDISGLKKKHSAPNGGMGSNGGGPGGMRSFEDQLQRQTPQQDIFGNQDAIVKYVLEGHDKGVNWATFHPKLPLIVSGGDDRMVKVWRMSETKAWEVDSCRGHTSNVPCVLFHPTEDLIISVGEDRTIRTWDLNKRTPIKQFKRESDRFWLIASHPTINLFATCHDSGIMVFKLDRERPASTIYQNTLYFVNNEKQIQTFNYNNNQLSLPMLSLKKIGKNYTKIKSLSYNPSENSALVTTGDNNDSSTYSLVKLPKDITGAIEPADLRQGDCKSAYFISRNRFVAFNKVTSKLEIKDLNNNVTKSIDVDSSVKDILPSSNNIGSNILLLSPSKVVLYDTQQNKELKEIQINNVKYSVWSNDNKYLALLSKHTITIVNKDFETIMSMHETIRVKSAAWDETGVLIYSTLNHIKYVLLNGDSGTIKTLDSTLYITRVSKRNCYCLNRKGEVEVVTIDPTEYRFKKALINKNFNEVLRIIKNSNLVGQNIIGYLQKKGYPEIALQFVEDPETRFELSIECNNLEVALVEAKKLNNKIIWEKLGKEAISQGNLKVIEFVYQQLKQFEKLSFFYLISGELNKLQRMEQIAESRNDLSSMFTNSIYLNSIEKRIELLIAAGLVPLAYCTAVTNNLDELADSILLESGLTKEEVSSLLPESGKPSSALPVKSQIEGNWPLKETGISYFEQALMGNFENLSLEESQKGVESAMDNNDDIDDDEHLFDDAENLEDDEGWDLDEDLDVDLDDEVEEDNSNNVETAVEGTSVAFTGELGHWIRNSRCAAGYVAAGAFEQAAQMLNKQLGVVEFEPLRARFMEVYQANKIYVATMDEIPGIKTYIRDDPEEERSSKFKPYIPGFENLEDKLREGIKLFKSNKLQETIDTLREVIYTITVLMVDNEDDKDKCIELLTYCRTYILGCSIELTRRQIADDPAQLQRNLELAAYFTKVNLEPMHRLNALYVAMTLSFKNKNFSSTSYFASEFLSIQPSGAKADNVKKLKAKADQMLTDAIEIDFNQDAEFDICPLTFTPIYPNDPSVYEALTNTRYHISEKGKVCNITKITEIGAPASGLRILN